MDESRAINSNCVITAGYLYELLLTPWNRRALWLKAELLIATVLLQQVIYSNCCLPPGADEQYLGVALGDDALDDLHRLA